MSEQEELKDTLQRMWDDRVVALDYEAIPSADPEKYNKSGKRSIKLLNDCAQHGALVGADYRHLYNDKILVGEIEENSKIQIKEYSGYKFYKVVYMKNAKEVSYLDYPILLSLQPRGAAISRWPSAYKILDAVINDRPMPWEVFSLDLNQLEVICYEFLKEQKLIEHLLLPIGRTLRDIDIIGVNRNGCKVLAQVTFSRSTSEIWNKAERLISYNKNGEILYFFCPDQVTDIKNPKIKYIAIESVFNFFGKDSTILKTMLGYQ
jgi:hypothetical protein